MSMFVHALPQTATVRPPVAAIKAKADTLHGDIRVDNYYWLREKSNPEVIGYLESENAYTDGVMAPVAEWQDSLFREMRARIKEADLDVPYRDMNYFYYTRTEEGKQYPIYCRKKESLDAPEEIILDQNEMAKGMKFLRFGALAISPDQSLLAFSADTNGSEEFTLFVKDLRNGTLLIDRLLNTVSVVWAMDSKTIFYTTRDAAKRPHRVYRHTLGTNREEDPLLYEETDELYNIYLSRSKSQKYIFLTAGASNADEVRYIPASEPMAEFKVVIPRQSGHEYAVSHRGDKFYIVTNNQARNFRLVEAPVSDPQMSNWKELLPARDDVTLEGVDLFEHYLIAFEREKGLQKMRIADFRTNAVHYIEFPEPVYSAFASTNRVFETDLFRYSYQSLTTPSSIFDYHMGTRERTLLKQAEVVGGYDPSEYTSERIFAKADDGVEVPISIVYKKGIVRNGVNPLHLYGYGSYGSSSPTTFSSNRLSLLNRGIIFAIAHVRGGGDMGRQWYDDGKLLKKRNTFTDFIACAEHLIKERYTSPEHLTIEGGSAGGLLVGAVTNMRPDLFKAVVAQVPFVDVMNTMLDASLPLTVGEYLEWGNPNEKMYYEYMRTYCPYTNVKAQAYPNILVKVGLNDPRVSYWEGTKWAAKIRAMKTNGSEVLLKVNMGSGHGGSSGRFDRLKEIAFDYAFILKQHGFTTLTMAPQPAWKK